ncbi:MAG: ABC transporter permease [Stackebrandtia sp.]
MIAGTLYAFEHWLHNYRRVWHGSLISNFVMPVLFLLGIGFGVGAHVENTSALGGVDYVHFVAPGLLASTGFQIVAGEMTWPVFGALRWGKQYRAMQASPLTPGQILGGHLLYGLLRGTVAGVVFLLVMTAFGLVSSPWAPLATLAAAGVAFSTVGWVYAYSVWVKNEVALSIIHRFGIVPLSLLSGIFFPLSQLPPALQSAAWISPLWHAAELCRWATTGVDTGWPLLAHAAYLVALGAGGCWVANKALLRRLTI